MIKSIKLGLSVCSEVDTHCAMFKTCPELVDVVPGGGMALNLTDGRFDLI